MARYKYYCPKCGKNENFVEYTNASIEFRGKFDEHGDVEGEPEIQEYFADSQKYLCVSCGKEFDEPAREETCEACGK